MKMLILAVALLTTAAVEAQNARPPAVFGGMATGTAVNGSAAQPAANFTPQANYFPPPVVYRVMVAPVTNQPAPAAFGPRQLRVLAAPVAVNGTASAIIARARP